MIYVSKKMLGLKQYFENSPKNVTNKYIFSSNIYISHEYNNYYTLHIFLFIIEMFNTIMNKNIKK